MDGIERLDLMLQGQLDNALIKVVTYLKNLKDIDPAIYLKEEKNLKGMCDYVKSKAKEFAVNGVAMIEDETVYEWSLTYFQQSNEELGIKKEEPRSIPKVNNVVKPKIEENQKEQLTLF